MICGEVAARGKHKRPNQRRLFPLDATEGSAAAREESAAKDLEGSNTERRLSTA